ncbi:MAG: RibD family protein [Streptosporangiaceae bacterium]
MERPYVLLSCAMSLDGYIDDGSPARLLLSSDEDLDQVDDLRAGCDAIMIGAGTLRADDPVLMLHSARRREARVASGREPDPVRVVVSASGNLDRSARLFRTGTDRVVYVSSAAAAATAGRLGDAATVVDAGTEPRLDRILDDLAGRGVSRLMAEGGASLHAQFLTSGLADELRLAVAPFFVGEAGAPRFAGPGRFPWNVRHRAALAGVSQVGDMAILRYALSDRCAI